MSKSEILELSAYAPMHHGGRVLDLRLSAPVPPRDTPNTAATGGSQRQSNPDASKIAVAIKPLPANSHPEKRGD